MTPLRLALVASNYHYVVDGAALTLNRLVAYLQRHGASVRVVTPMVPQPPIAAEGELWPAHAIPLPGRPEYRFGWGLPGATRAAITAFRPNLVHVTAPDLLGRVGARLARRLGVPCVTSYHAHLVGYMKHYGAARLEGVGWWYLRRFYRRCTHVYVPSESIGQELERHGIRGNLRHWGRGVDTDRFDPRRRSLAWRRAQGIDEHETVVLFSGRLVREKGLRIYAETVARLASQGLAVRALVMGTGPATADLAAAGPHVVRVGHLEDETLAVAYASSDLFLFPSETETFGNATLEAMASGLPAVCADAPGSRSLVVPGETGFLAAPDDVEGFATRTAELIADPTRRAIMGEAARKRACTHSWTAEFARLATHYDELLSASSAS